MPGNRYAAAVCGDTGVPVQPRQRQPIWRSVRLTGGLPQPCDRAGRCTLGPSGEHTALYWY